MSVVHPTWQQSRPDIEGDTHCGWTFRSPTDSPVVQTSGHGSFACTDCVPDDVNNARFIRDLYEMANDTHGKYSVPILWDKVEKTIVNNESGEIIRMLNTAFNEVASHPEVDFYPEPLRPRIDEVNEWVYHHINNGVYRCGFAKSQAAYDQAVSGLFTALDRAEEILADNHWLTGDMLTEADLRLFPTLVRFDEVYIVYFKCHKKRISDYSNLRNFMREIYQIPGIAATTNMFHIKTHYFTSHPVLNPHAVIPVGPDVLADLQQPHDRDRFVAP